MYRFLLEQRPLARGVLPGIKLFPLGRDGPLLTWRQLFGRAPVIANTGVRQYMAPVPRVIVLT